MEWFSFSNVEGSCDLGEGKLAREDLGLVEDLREGMELKIMG